MFTKTTETTDATETRTDGETDRRSRTRRLLSSVRRRGGNGTSAALAGGTLLVTAARAAARNQRRAGVFALAGAALLGVGLRRRTAEGASRPDERTGRHSAEATAHRTASDLVDRSETDPRGVSDSSDVETDSSDGTIQFTTGRDEAGEPNPHLDVEDPADPRYADGDDPVADDHVEVSLSETRTTDELGKVAAPDEEQAYPASEGTDPEPMSEEAPPRYGEGAAGADRDPDDDRASGDESEDGEETT